MPLSSLRLKLIAFNGAIVILLLTIVGVIVSVEGGRRFAEEIDQRRLHTATTLARAIEPAVLTNDLAAIYRWLQRVVEEDDVLYVHVLAPDGTVILDSELARVGERVSEASASFAAESDVPAVGTPFRNDDGGLLDEIVAPVEIGGRRLATVVLGHSHDVIEQQTRGTWIQIAGAGAVGALLSLLLVSIAANYISRPIERLTSAIAKVAEGDRSTFVTVDRTDEIGILGHAFNTMVEDLQRTTVSLDAVANIFDSAPDGIIVTDLDHHVLFSNRAKRQLLTALGKEQIDGSCGLSVCGSTAAEDGCLLARIEAGESFIQHDIETTTAGGDELFLTLTATPLIEQGKLAGMVLAFQDMTSRSRAERERRELQQQLLQSQKLESMGRLAGGIAHDFNNLLSVMVGYTELGLHHLGPNHPLAPNLRMVMEAGDRAGWLTRQLLAVSRKQVLDMKILNLAELVQRIGAMLSRVLEPNIRLELRHDLAGPNVFADQGQIEQVVMNLVLNARDAMPDGGTLTISVTHEAIGHDGLASTPKPGRYVLLSVADTGIGMSPEVQRNIFEPFFTTKEHSRGTGLGLSTVYGIVRQHGGDVLVDSAPGSGTTFRIYLQESEKTALAVAPTRPQASRGDGETVLVVDDDPGLLKMVCDSLEALGYEVIAASSGDEALELVERGTRQIDLLLTDVVMPGISGWELADLVASRGTGIRTAVMSGYAPTVNGDNQEVAARHAFIQKPITLTELAQRLQELLHEPTPDA